MMELMIKKMLDAKKLEYYLRLQVHYGNSSLLPKDVSDIRVLNIKKISGGMNNVYVFLLRFTKGESVQSLNLVLKGYSEEVGLWFKISHPDEEVRKYIREYDTLKALQIVGFPVSKVYLCEIDSFFLGYPFLIMRQEKVMQESVSKLNSFAATLAALHNLEVDKLGIKSLSFPKDGSEFVRARLSCLKLFMNETRHYGFLKKNFDYAINWLESNAEDNNCPKYCLIHGEYHPGHTLLTNNNRLTVIDWESVAIGDPAFDAGYAYHLVRLMYNCKNSNIGEETAETFLSEYTKNFQGDVHQRIEFYKIVSLLGVAVVVSSWISNPIQAYKCFGNQAFARALIFPFLRSRFLAKRWLNEDFLVFYLQYCQNFIKINLKR
jgi:aminoglycoside phosphotransferase (APT) family kinase protein